MKYQFGSFEVQSAAMLSVIQSLHENLDKKYFIVSGDTGSGKTTMLSYIKRVAFHNTQTAVFDDAESIPSGLSSALVATAKDTAREISTAFDPAHTHMIEMPSLAERKADVPGFSAFFIEVLSLMNNQRAFRLTEKAIEKLLQYNWPGNFSELESVLERAFVNSQNADAKAMIEPEHIELDLQSKELEFSIGQKLDEVERKYILQTLYFVHQNRTKAAEILGISIRTLRNKINQYREEGYL